MKRAISKIAAFTLIELLVVVAMLMPVIQKVHEPSDNAALTPILTLN